MKDSRSACGAKEAKSGQVISIQKDVLHRHLDKVVLGSIEETLNALLDEEADRLFGARRYERSPDRKAPRAGLQAEVPDQS